MKKISFYFIVLSIFLTSCQSVKDGLSGRKSENSDEFLVQKKNPLVTPPDYLKLPKPKDQDLEDEALLLDEETDIQRILNVNKDTNEISKDKFENAEKFVLENIK